MLVWQNQFCGTKEKLEVLKMSDYKVWECKIVVPGDVKLPSGFDAPPRSAVMEAIERHGVEIITCFSGWGGALTKEEEAIVKSNMERK